MIFDINIIRNESNDNTDQVNQTHVRKFFHHMGWFEGNVININKENNCNSD